MFPLMLCCCGMGCALLMSFNQEGLLMVPLVLPLLGSLWICLLPGKSVSSHRLVALFVSLATFLLSLLLWANFLPNSPEPFQQIVGFAGSWNGTLWIRLEFGLDGLSLWMVLLTTFLMPIAVLCSWWTQKSHSQAFMALLLLLETCLLASFTCLDLLGFYVFYECSLLPMFLLIGLGGSRPRKVRAAYLLVIYTLVGSLAMLPCVLLMYSQAGSTSYLLLATETWATARQYVLWWGLFLAFAVKVPMIPLHLWLPEAHVEASTAGSVLLAGVLLKLGSYGLLRFSLPLLPEASAYYGPLVLCLSMIGLVYASLTTLRQVDLKKLIAYSSIAHMSMVIIALFTLNDLGAIGGSFLILAHGVASPALFLLVGAMYDRAHTKALKYLGGAATAMPLYSLMFFLFSLCNMALPLSPNFVGEFLCLCSVFAHHLGALIAALIAVILSAAYTMWAYARVVHGMPKPHFFEALADLNRREFWTLLPLLAVALWWGLKPGLVLDQLSSSLWFWHQATYGSTTNLNECAWISEILSFLSILFQNQSILMFLNAIIAPFLGSLAAGLGGRWLGARGSGVLTVLGLGTSAVCSIGILLEVLVGGSPVVLDMGSWFQGSTVHVSWIACFDSLTACMMVTVTTVSFCVHTYSLGYMQNDPHLPRFMSYLSLFTGGMLVLVTASDLITLLVGWELIGVCSYLLIGFWFHRLSATKAAQKAVLVNRVSDTALIVGLMTSWWYLGSTDLSLLTATSTSASYTDFLCAMLLAGALGKSAQIGLHVWLADAMEGLIITCFSKIK
jgi:proton-translocating NADH-quinone oxidoreductase chain M